MAIIEAVKKEDIKIGMKFIRVGTKRKDIETIVDIYKTYNSKGELVKTEYVTEHLFMGQTMRNTVNVVTIQRGLMEYGEQ